MSTFLSHFHKKCLFLLKAFESNISNLVWETLTKFSIFRYIPKKIYKKFINFRQKFSSNRKIFVLIVFVIWNDFFIQFSSENHNFSLEIWLEYLRDNFFLQDYHNCRRLHFLSFLEKLAKNFFFKKNFL